jgi:two-component system, LuxR family, response regulator FixJ
MAMSSNSVVHIVDDDDAMRDSLTTVLEDAGYEVRGYSRAEDLLNQCLDTSSACVVTDVRMPGIDGLSLLSRLRTTYKDRLPLVLITGHGDVHLAVAAMKAGAVDFLEKPFDAETLLGAVEAALQTQVDAASLSQALEAADRKLKLLTPREYDVLEELVAGRSNKQIAFALDLSPRTVEFHRAHVMEKTGVQNVAELVRLWMLADASHGSDSTSAITALIRSALPTHT